MTAQPRSELIICPICKGKGQLEAHARRYRVGMAFWIERSCRCCHGDGIVSKARVQEYRLQQATPQPRGYLLRSKERS